MDYDFWQEEVKRLSEHGYIELAADKYFFDRLYNLAKAKYPDVNFVKRVGNFAVGQIIFLPKAKKEIIRRLRRDLGEASKLVGGLTDALQKITGEKTPA